MTYLKRWLGPRYAAVVAVALALVTVGQARAAEPRVDIRQAQVSGTQVSAPSNRGKAVLTLDPDLQRDVQTLVQRSRAPEAAAVVIDVKTGRILAWASVDKQGRDLVSEPYAPPASLFKVVTAAALLEKTKARTTSRQCYVGGERTVRLSDLRSSGAGGAICAPLSTALGFSRNLVMAGLAVRFLQPDHLREVAEDFGLNGGVPIDVRVGSGSVRVPSSDEGMARAAAGFGPGRMTPLEAAYMMAVIARRGERPALRLIDHLVTDGGRALAPSRPRNTKARAIRASTADQLNRMLRVTVREGTAAHAFRDRNGERYLGALEGAGKTGTLSRGKPRRLFSWYAGFAPANRPEVAVAVMLANEQRWWRKGNDVARDVLRAYFARKQVAGVTHPLRRRSARR